MEWLWILAGASLLLTVALVIVVPQRFAPREIAPPELERRKFQLEVVKAFAEVLGGAFFLVTLVLGWQQIQSTQEQLEVARQGQITERFTRAIDQLGSSESTTRVGGVFALESIAKDSPRDRQAVLEVLASFLRQRPHPTTDPSLRDWKASRGMNPSADIEAAAVAIGRRDREGEIDSKGRCSRLATADSASSCRLSLVGANLSGINLNGSDFSEMDLRRAVFNYANVPFASFSNSDMQSADLRGANLNQSDVSGASLLLADLEGANMNGVKGLTCKQLTDSRGRGHGAANVRIRCP